MGVVWAITRLTLLRALRQKTAPILIMAVLLGGPGLSLFLEGGLGLMDLVKTVLTFNVAIVSAALMLLTLYLSTTVLNSDIVGKQIFLVDTKPAARWKVLLGIWLGVSLLLAWLLLLAGVGTYLAALAFASAGRWTVWAWARSIFFWLLAAAAGGGVLAFAFAKVRQRLPRARAGWWWGAAVLLCALCAWRLAAEIRGVPRRNDRRGQDIADVWRQLLIARQSFRAPLPDIDNVLRERRLRLEQAGNDFSGWKPEEFRRQLIEDVNKNTWRIPFRGMQTFSFSGLPPQTEMMAEFMVRYKLHIVGGGFGVSGWLVSRGEGSGMAGVREATFKSGRPEEFILDYSMVGDGGKLDISIANLGLLEEDKPATFFMPLADGLELLVPAGSFGGNLARAYFMLWIRLAMIAMFGVMANSFMGGPVSAFFLFGFICVGLGNSTILTWFVPEQIEGMPPAEMTSGQAFAADLARVVLGALPDFGQTDPTDDLLAGRLINWWRILRQLLRDVGFRGGLAALVAGWAYSRREVGMPTYV